MRARMAAAIVAAAWLGGATPDAQQRDDPDLFRAAPQTYAPRYDPGEPPSNPPHLLPFALALDRPVSSRSAQLPGAHAEPDGRGYLSLFVRPVTAQVYVDGFFVGTVEDYAGSPGPLLDAGTRRVDIRAEGYETASFDVRMVPGEVVSLREDLVRTGAPPSRRATPLTSEPDTATRRAIPAFPRAFYVIPRCYAGDTPPKAADLPAGCRLGDLRVIAPGK